MQETFNHLGARFLSFAWPMLWQSSLLIVVVFTVDLMFARKLRASVRHALWLVVLVKLLLPPTLALPTSVAWWLFPAKPIIVPTAIPDPSPTALNTSVVYNDVPPPDFVQEPVPQIEPPRPSLNRAGWTLIATGAVSVGLLIWLLLRWWQLTRKVRRATPADAFPELLGAAKNWSAGLLAKPRFGHGSINRLLKRAGAETGAPAPAFASSTPACPPPSADSSAR